MAEPHHQGLVLHGAGEHAGVSIGIFVNNIQVTFLAYAGGITLGLLTGYVLATNGILLGAVAGLAAEAGNGGDLLRLVVGHGVLELSCIAVDGGRRAARRLVARRAGAGHARRARCAPRPARSVGIVLGTMPWLVLAGLVEGFVTGSVLAAVVLPLGIALGALYWGLVFTLGRAPRVAHAAAALALLRPRVRADAGAGEALGTRLDDDRARRAARRRAASARARRISSATVIA